VHPAKTEVRFRNQELVHQLFRESIEKALLLARTIPRFSVPKEEISERNRLRSAITDISNMPGSLPLRQASAAWPDESHSARISAETALSSGQVSSATNNSLLSLYDEHIEIVSSSITSVCEKLPVREEEAIRAALGDASSGFDSQSLRPIGHLSNTYILAADSQGLVIVDQHVAHERILFERFLNQLQSRQVPTQRLLIPLTFDLTPSQRLALEKIQFGLSESGFEIEGFGGHTVSVKTVPAGLDARDYQQLIVEIIENCDESPQQSVLDSFHRYLAAGMACRAAVKANTQLNYDKLLWLLDELAITKFPHACPHGRPIMLRLTLREIEKRFLRS
jgi:DNA mismatch repair protein MutL